MYIYDMYMIGKPKVSQKYDDIVESYFTYIYIYIFIYVHICIFICIHIHMNIKMYIHNRKA
jgi:hypothetical protein